MLIVIHLLKHSFFFDIIFDEGLVSKCIFYHFRYYNIKLNLLEMQIYHIR